MRKGRGLVDVDIYNELLKVPGARKLLLDNTTNHRTNPKTNKVCAEIHEDAWPEVKEMVANWKRFKKGQPQQTHTKIAPKKGTAVKKESAIDPKQQECIRRLRKLKPGDKFAYKNVGYGLTSYEDGSDAIEIKKGKLFTETFDSMGMEWTGATWKFDGGLGLVTYIVLMEDVPEGQLADQG
ncbi:MAG: hypothetical protein HYT93_00660 [Parcubacteria group bacterium]|nr:hypothetical protein [Parcubacteria group bacterium]